MTYLKPDEDDEGEEVEVGVQRLTATDSATLKHAFLPKATLDRAQQLYMQIAQSDKRNKNSDDDDDDELPGGMVLLMWNTHSSYCMHAAITKMLNAAARSLASSPASTAFSELVACTLAVARIDHWYSDIEEPAACVKIAKKMSAVWRDALCHTDDALGIDKDTR